VRKAWNLVFAVLILATLGLAGCASNINTAKDEPLIDQPNRQQRMANTRLQLAVNYYEQRQMNVALNEISRAIQAEPNFADAYSVRGLIYMDMGESRLAEENFLQALKLSPNSPDFNNNYGWFLCQNGKEAQSIAYFENALKIRSYQSPAKALNNAGTCSLKLKNNTAAEKYFVQAFQFDPANPTTNANLAKIYFDRNDYERARFYAGRVIKTDNANADALWLGIKIERKLGDGAAESNLASQLRRRYPTSAEYGAYQRGAFDE
jgi:type IV pilus assembly protein PilF